MRQLLLLLIIAFFVKAAGAQRTVNGEVRDRVAGTGLGGVLIMTADSTARAITDERGRFHLQVMPQHDSICISAVGYHPLTAAIS